MSMFPDTVLIKRRRITQSAMGGPVEAWATVGEFPARLSQLSAVERAAHGVETQVTAYKAFLLGDRDIFAKDELWIEDDRYEVKTVRKPRNARLVHHVECVVELLGPNP